MSKSKDSTKVKTGRAVHHTTLDILRFLKKRRAVSKGSAIPKKKGVKAGCRRDGWDSISERGWIGWVEKDGEWSAYLTRKGAQTLVAETRGEIEKLIAPLSVEEQQRLIEGLARRLRQSEQAAWEKDLDAMAADPAIRRELAQIDREFAGTESDGLENL